MATELLDLGPNGVWIMECRQRYEQIIVAKKTIRVNWYSLRPKVIN